MQPHRGFAAARRAKYQHGIRLRPDGVVLLTLDGMNDGFDFGIRYFGQLAPQDVVFYGQVGVEEIFQPALLDLLMAL